MQLAGIATGQDMNNPADMGKIREKREALKPQIATFWSSEDEWNKYMQAGQFDIAVYWSGSAARSKKAFGLPVEFVVPTSTSPTSSSIWRSRPRIRPTKAAT